MGMASRIAARWGEANRKYMAIQREASDVAGGLGSISKVFRMILQSGVLAVGAWLVINQQATAGIIIAGSILSARALAPVDLAIANWKSFAAARQSWKRLTRLLAYFPERGSADGAGSAAKLDRGENRRARSPPGDQKVVVQDIQFTLRPAAVSASSGRADRENPGLRGSWSASGRRRAEKSASTARRSTNGRRKRSGPISAICRRTSNC